MAGSEEDQDIIVCYACEAPMNIASVAPYSRVVCPDCGTENRVKKQFGPYTVTRKHAIGGMSSVFVARDEALNREVALKILSEEYSKDEKRIAAFEQEARLTASFSHPNVVRVLTTGKSFDRFYIAMEFVPGGHFEHQIREQGKISETEILPLAIQIAEGLKGAQAAGLIHRDVKPGNILLDSEGNAKIVDFGLALVTKGGKAKATEIWATPYYVPPEAIEGGVEDFRADIYAFGATLYHALAGKPPCDQESMATDLLREAKKKIIPLKKAAPYLLDETCAVIDRAMAYEPVNRFWSYDEMISGLAGALKAAQGESVRDEEGISKAERRAQLRRKKRRGAFLVASSVALVCAVTVALLLSRTPEPKPAKNGSRVVSIDDAATTGSESLQEIATRYNAGRDAMYSGDYQKADKRFSVLLATGDVQEPTRTWAGLQAVLATAMDGRMDLARERAEAVSAHIASGPADLSPGFSIGVQPVLARMSGLDLFDMAEMDLGEKGSERFMGYLIAGLKNWEQGAIDQAVPFFEKISSEPSLKDNGVLGWYQEKANQYLVDYKALKSDPMEMEPATKKECRAARNELNRTLTLMKTKGRARFNIHARQLALAKMEKSMGERKAPEPRKDVLEEMGSLAKDYRLVEVVDMVSELREDPPDCKKAALLGVSQSALVFLSEIERDLSAKPVAMEFEIADGTEIDSLAFTEEKGLVGRTVDGATRDLNWKDFSPDQLIELHRKLVKSPAGEIERLRRHESAIAFEWLAGDKERAIAAAGRLCAESESFRERWELIASGLPK